MSKDLAEKWIPSFCGMCYNICSLRACVVDGTVTMIEGNPESPYGLGKL